VIRIVDFESSYEVARHSKNAFYNPPTTPGFSAPEVHDRAPDSRVDVFSLGAVLYTMIAGYGSAWETELAPRIEADAEIDMDLKTTLLKAVDRDASKRYPSIQEMRGALAAYLESIWPGRS
jgi:serine/threonine protein kinase